VAFFLNNMEESRIITGTMKWGSWGKNLSASAMSRLIETIFELGINTFDHADIYGDYSTEAAFGSAFSTLNIDRKEVRFISKCGIQLVNESRGVQRKHYEYSAQYIRQQVEQSLNNLQTEYLDVLLLHRPSPLMDYQEIGTIVTDLLQEKKINQFGVSNFTPSQISLLQKTCPVAINQLEISFVHPDALLNGTLDFHQLHGIATQAWSPLGNYFTSNDQSMQPLLTSMAKKYECSVDQLLLAWLLKHPANIKPVIGTTNPEHIQAAKLALEIHLTTEDWFELLALSRGEDVA
jgi:predicted oxidoreductase